MPITYGGRMQRFLLKNKKKFYRNGREGRKGRSWCLKLMNSASFGLPLSKIILYSALRFAARQPAAQGICCSLTNPALTSQRVRTRPHWLDVLGYSRLPLRGWYVASLNFTASIFICLRWLRAQEALRRVSAELTESIRKMLYAFGERHFLNEHYGAEC